MEVYQEFVDCFAMQQLRGLRIALGLTRKVVAERMGVSVRKITAWEDEAHPHITMRQYAGYVIACGYIPMGIHLEPVADVAERTPDVLPALEEEGIAID